RTRPSNRRSRSPVPRLFPRSRSRSRGCVSRGRSRNGPTRSHLTSLLSFLPAALPPTPQYSGWLLLCSHAERSLPPLPQGNGRTVVDRSLTSPVASACESLQASPVSFLSLRHFTVVAAVISVLPQAFFVARSGNWRKSRGLHPESPSGRGHDNIGQPD